MNKRSGLAVLRYVLALVAGGYSLALVATQLRDRTHYPLLLLGALELAAAILFLISSTMRVGGIALIVTFAVAALFHIAHGEYGIGYLAVYGAAAFAVISTGERR